MTTDDTRSKTLTQRSADARHEPVIVSACRTAVGGLGGALSAFPAWRLGETVIREALRRAGVAPAAVDEVIMGNVLTAGQGQGPARQAALAAGVPVGVPATTINMVCGSGLRAVAMAAQAVRLGEASVVVAGGMESMSQAPYLLPQARAGYRLGNGPLLDSLVHDGLWCSIGDTHMGITAENLAQRYAISREEQDRFAVQSHNRAEAAIAAGRFAAEIVPVPIPQRKGPPAEFKQDEHVRMGSTLEAVARLRPAFRPEAEGGTVTAGNASGINDGAAALVVTSRARAGELGLKPLATILGYAAAGVEPSVMGIGPVDAVRTALKRAGAKLEDIELAELNEAFAAQALAVLRELPLDPAIVNVNGGAIALGHPIGASGARILVTLLYEMERRGAALGLAGLCIGGGMGMAMVVRR
ncbi:MAG: acetyl-CoA C-acetyltransferase [Bacillota bacterium]|nr:acetyl-CoA C-acetyltransferase [Bacillota bacterium]